MNSASIFVTISFILMVLGIGFIIYLVTLKLLILWRVEREKTANTKNFKLLMRCIDQDALDEMAILRIFKKRNEDLNHIIFNYILNYNLSYERFLESFLIFLISTDTIGAYHKKARNVIVPIIQRIKDENPYSNVNERERRMLLSIDDTTKKSPNLTESEKAAIKHNLDDLAMALEENQNTLKKSKIANKWSIPVSVIGVLLTLIFGILQLFS
jgi:hypothetical protein